MRSQIAAILASVAMANNVFNLQKAGGDDPYVETCWVKAYGRGAGVTPNYCDPFHDLSKGKCYEPCQVHYTGDG